MASDARAQRLLDEFQEGANWDGAYDIRRGLAWVLRHLADVEADDPPFSSAPIATLNHLADALARDAAARQFLREAGCTDASGNWLPQFQSPQETDD